MIINRDISLISAQVIGPSIAHGRSFLSKQGKVFHICIQVFLLCTHHVTLSIYRFTCSVQDREKNVFGKGQDPVFLHVSRLTERLQKKNCHYSNPTVLPINLARKRKWYIAYDISSTLHEFCMRTHSVKCDNTVVGYSGKIAQFRKQSGLGSLANKTTMSPLL